MKKITKKLAIENSGNYSTFCPEFSKGQFLKTCGAINRIVHKKNKKGITLTNAVSAVVAILGSVLILWYFSRLYSDAAASEDQTKAHHLLDIVLAKIEALPENQIIKTDIQGFSNDWYLTGWGKNDANRPDKCFFNSCVCICKSGGRELKDNCQSNGFCRKLENIRNIKVESYILAQEKKFEASAEGKNLVPTGEYNVKNPQLINLPGSPPFLEIHLEKTKTSDNKLSLKIAYYSQEYLTWKAQQKAETEQQTPEPLVSKELLSEKININGREISVLDATILYQKDEINKNDLEEEFKNLLKTDECIGLAKSESENPAGLTGIEGYDDFFIKKEQDNSFFVGHVGNTPLLLTDYKRNNLLKASNFLVNNKKIYLEYYYGKCLE